MKEIQGVGLNRLCAIGRLHFYGRWETGLNESKRTVTGDEISTELQRLEIAFESFEELYCEGEREALHEELHERAKLALFEGYATEDAVYNAAERLFSELVGTGDPYISEMGVQVIRMSRELAGILSKEKTKIAGLSPKPVILVCGNISLKELITADKSMILGIILCETSPLSELAIYAHSLGVPLIISRDNAIYEAYEGETVIIDSEKGIIITSPEDETVAHYGVRLGGIALNSGKLLSHGKNRIICYANDSSSLSVNKSMSCRSMLLRIGEEKGTEELVLIFSSIFDELDLEELKIILPEKETNQKAVISAAIRASEKGKIILILPSASDISSVRAIKYNLYSELEKEIENISFGAVIQCGALCCLIDEIAEGCSFFAVDSDKLLSSLIFPKTVSPNDEALISLGYKAFLKVAEFLIDTAKSRGIRLCFFGMTASREEICEKLLALGAHEVSIPFSYF